MTMWLQGVLASAVVLYLSSDVAAQLGKRCQTPNGETATCKSIYDCQKLLNAVRTRSETQVRFLRESQCGYSGNPLVCCGTKDNFDRSGSSTVDRNGSSGRRVPNDRNGSSGQTGNDEVLNRSSEIPKNDAIPDRDTCGSLFSDRIFRGENTTLEEFPWMALLEYRSSAGRKRFSCGGTVISSRYILTAAHCVTGEIRRKVGDLVNVRLGEWNTDTDVDCLGDICSDPPQNVGIEETIVHPNYDNDLADRYYDIALVRLKRNINYSKYIKPICLPLPNESSSLGEKLTVAGWGKTESANRSPIKQKLEVPIAEKTECTSKFRSAGVRLSDTQLCAGGVAGKDSCTGDSGGPLMRPTRSDVSQWYIEGIVSFGATCGLQGWPGIYTKVTSYLPWIYKTVKP